MNPQFELQRQDFDCRLSTHGHPIYQGFKLLTTAI